MISLFLVIIIFFLLLLSLILTNDILFPSNIIITGFFIGSICNWLILTPLKYDISSYTLYLIVSYLIMFLISSVMFGKFINGKKLNSALIYKEDKNGGNIKYIYISNFKVGIIILIQVLAIIFFVIQFNKMIGPINSSTLSTYRFYTTFSQNNIYEMPSWINSISNLSQIASLVSIYILINNSFIKRDIAKTTHNSTLLLLISSLISLPLPLLNGSRYNIITIIIYTITLYMYFEKRVNKTFKKSIKFMVIFMIIILLFFQLSGIIIGRPSGQSSSFEYYFGGGIALLDTYIRDPFANVTNSFGINTFNAIYKTLSKLGIGVTYYKPTNEFRYINGQLIGNVYSCIQTYISDFGFYGMCALSIISGAFFGIYYKLISFISLNKLSISLIIYFYIMNTLILSAYMETIYSTLMTAGFYINIIIIYLIGKFYIKKYKEDQDEH